MAIFGIYVRFLGIMIISGFSKKVIFFSFDQTVVSYHALIIGVLESERFFGSLPGRRRRWGGAQIGVGCKSDVLE